MNPTARFLYWIKERHSIFWKKEAGHPKPWTEDPILQTHFFTNPYRENDKVTRWFRKCVRGPLKSHKEVLFATICFRWFNYIPTGMALQSRGLLTDWDTVKCQQLLRGRDKIFTGAFNISNSGSTKPKLDRVTEDYIQPVWEHIPKLINGMRECETLQDACALLRFMPGLGGSGFMAAQVVCDLKYTNYLNSATDWWTWCSPGPGSKRGLNILYGRDPNGPPPPLFLEKINKLRELVSKHLPELPKFHAQDMQNCCCEFFKYERARATGKSKRRYQGV